MGQLAYDLQTPTSACSASSTYAGFGNSTSSPAHPRPHSGAGRRESPTRQVEAAVSMFQTFSPRQTKLFFDLLLAQMSIGGKEALIRVVYGSLSRSGPADGNLFSPSSAAVRDHPLVGTWTEDDILNGFASSIATGRTEELLTHIRRAVNSATSVAANTAAFGAMRSAPEDFDDEEEGIGSTMIAAMHQRQEARNVDEVFRAIFTTLGRS